MPREEEYEDEALNPRASDGGAPHAKALHLTVPLPPNPVASYLHVAKAEPIMYSLRQDEAVDHRGIAIFKPQQYSGRLWAALLAEFIGLAIFQVYGGSANDEVAAFGNGLTLATAIYATANVSGGHLNPAVTFAQCLTGHISWSKGALYVVAQLLGAIFGALVLAGIVPDVAVGAGVGPGCFTHTHGLQITVSQLWWWETLMTFLLVSVVYSTAVTKPGFGNIAPLAIGFSLFASAFIGGPFTGAALNPARVLGPAIIFDCYWHTAFIYVFAELFGALIAAALILPLYGFGQFGSLFDARFLSWTGLAMPSNARDRDGFLKLQEDWPMGAGADVGAASRAASHTAAHTEQGGISLSAVPKPPSLVPQPGPSMSPSASAPPGAVPLGAAGASLSEGPPPRPAIKPGLAALAKAQGARDRGESLNWHKV